MADEAIIIGKVSVKVTPDTSGIPRELKVKLEAIEDRVDPIEIETEVDTSGIEREVKNAVRNAERRAGKINLQMDLDNRDSVEKAIRDLQKEVNKLDEDFKISVDLDREKLVAAQKDLNEALGEIPVDIEYHNDFEGLLEAKRQLERLVRDHSTISLTVDPDEESLRRELDKVNDQIADFERDRKLTFDVEPNRRSIEKALQEIDRKLGHDGTFHFEVEHDEESLRKLRHHLEELKDDFDNTELKFEPTMDGVNYRFTAFRLSALARDRWVQFKPILDSKAASAVATSLAALSGARMLGETFSNLWDLVKNLDKNIPLIGGVTAAIMGLTSWLMAAISNTFALSRSLAQIFGAALALPGILGGFAVGVGAAYAVLKDIDAVLPGIGERFGELRREMSDRFWSRAAQPVWQAFQTFIEPFSEGLHDTSLALGTWFSDMAESASEHLAGSLPAMFRNLNDSIRIAAAGADDFGGILEILGRRGSEYLPRMAQWWNRITRDFRGWLNEADRTGRLNDIIETGLEQLHQFGRVLKEAGGILTDFAIAAEEAGGSTLTILADQLEDIHNVTSRQSFHDGLVRVFESAHDAMDRIATNSGPRVSEFFKNLVDIFETGLPDIGEVLGDLIGGFAEALSTEGFTQGFLDFLRGIREGVEELEPVWTQVGDGLGALGTLAGDIAREFGPLLAEALRLAADAAERLGPLLGSIAQTLSGRLLGILEITGPLIVTLADAFVRMIDPLLRIPGLVELVVGAFALWKVASLVGDILNLTSGIRTLTQQAFPRLHEWLRRIGPMATGVGLGILAIQAAVAQVNQEMKATTSEIGAQLDASTFDGIADGAWRMSDGLRDAINESLGQMDRGQLAIEHAFDVIRGEATKSSEVVGNTLSDLFTAYGEMAQRAEVSTSELLGAINGLTSNDVDVQRLAEMTRMFDEILSGLVQDGSLGDAKVLYDGLRDALQGAGYSAEAAVAAFPQYNTALEENAIQAAIAADEEARLNAEMLGLGENVRIASEDVSVFEEALRQVNGVTPELVQSIADAATAFVDLSEGLDADNWDINSYLDGLEEQVRAMGEWADNMALLAQRGNQDVLAALRDLGPEGAKLVSDLADEMEAGGSEAWDRFAAVVEAGTAESVLATSEGLSSLDAVVSGAMLAAQLAAENGMNQIELAAILAGEGVLGGLAAGLADNDDVLAGQMDTLRRALQGDLEALALLGTPEGEALVRNVAEALNLGIADATIAGEALAYGVGEGLNVGTAGFYQAGSDAKGKYLSGLGDNPELTKNGGEALARFAQDGAKSVTDWIDTGKAAVTQFLDGIINGQPLAKNGGDALAKATVEGIAKVVPQWGDTAGLGTSAFIGQIDTSRSKAKTAGDGLTSSVKSGLDPLAGIAQGKGTETGLALQQGLKGQVRYVAIAAKNMADEMVGAWKSMGETAFSAGNSIGVSFVKGILQQVDSAASAGRMLGSSVVVGGQGFYGSLFNAGAFAGSGFVAGVNSQRQSAYNAGYNLGVASLNGSRTALRVASPSKEMMEVGHWAGEGLVKGINSMQFAVALAGSRIADTLGQSIDTSNLGRDLADGVKGGSNAFLASIDQMRVAMNLLLAGLDDMHTRATATAARIAEVTQRALVSANALAKVQRDLAIANTATQATGTYQGASIYLTVNNPTERSTQQELNKGLQMLDALVDR